MSSEGQVPDPTSGGHRPLRALGSTTTPLGMFAGRKPVVTAFIQQQQGKILLVKRSQMVGTYQGYWGGVSGGMEGNEKAIDRAYTEILEEVGYETAQLHYIRSGRPLDVNDGQRRFLIFPFIFALCDSTILPSYTLNWENDAAAFVTRMEMNALKTVPLLDDTLERVVLGSVEEKLVSCIQDDRSHGAAQLSVMALEKLLEYSIYLEERKETKRGQHVCQSLDDVIANDYSSIDRTNKCHDALKNLAWHLACCRPSMAAVGNAIASSVSEAFKRINSMPPNTSLSTEYAVFREVLQEYITSIRDSNAALLDHAVQHIITHTPIKDTFTFMTLSLSSSVDAFVCKLLRDRDLKLRIYVCESRPLFEGVQVAATWQSLGAEVTVIIEAEAGCFMHDVDSVILGADAITSTGIVNKVGSKMVAMMAHAENTPVQILATTQKAMPGSIQDILFNPGAIMDDAVSRMGDGEEKSADEVRDTWIKSRIIHPDAINFSIRNVYFEMVPSTYLTSIITEKGPLDAQDIPTVLEAVVTDYCTAFSPP